MITASAAAAAFSGHIGRCQRAVNTTRVNRIFMLMTKTAIAIAIAMPQGKTISRKEKRKKLKDEQDGQCQSIPNSTSGHHHRLILSVITGH